MPKSIQFKPNGLIYHHFYESHKDNYIFANYWSQSPPLVIDGTYFKTPEHYFQSQKFPKNTPAYKAVLHAETADYARTTAQRFFANDNDARNKWFAGDDYQAMLNVVRARFKQDEAFRNALLDTQNHYIYEDTYKGPPSGGPPDTKWGGGLDGKGENLLGLALMEVRNEYYEKQGSNKLVVDIKKLRQQAQNERDEIDSVLASQGIRTQGRALEEIRNDYTKVAANTNNYVKKTLDETPVNNTPQVQQTIPLPKGNEQITNAKSAALNVLSNRFSAKNIFVCDTDNARDKEIKVVFHDHNAALKFLSFVRNTPISKDGVTVILSEQRAQQLFEQLGVAKDSGGRNMLDVLKQAQAQPLKDRSVDHVEDQHMPPPGQTNSQREDEGHRPVFKR